MGTSSAAVTVCRAAIRLPNVPNRSACCLSSQTPLLLLAPPTAACTHCATTQQCVGKPLCSAAYSITGAVAMKTIANLIGSSLNKEWQLVLVMGALELVFSQAGGWWAGLMGGWKKDGWGNAFGGTSVTGRQ